MAARGKTGSKRAPGEGERAARRGYVHQDRASARLIYRHLLDRSLKWIGLADRTAGIADDLVLGLSQSVLAHQFKRSLQPKAFGLEALLLGAQNTVADLAAAFFALRTQSPAMPVRIAYITNDYPSTNDTLVRGQTGTTTADFLCEVAAHRDRTLTDWRGTRWHLVFDRLAEQSGVNDAKFEAFWAGLEIVSGAAAAQHFIADDDPGREAQVEALARFLSTLTADNPARDRWSREALLSAVGWHDRFALRHVHDFPVGHYVQRNEITEADLAAAVRAHTSGYVSLVGPPGTGKSTLLQREVRGHVGQHVMRYLAFVPGAAQGQGRGEVDSFYDDVNAQLAATGLHADRVIDDSTRTRQRQFENLLRLAGERFRSDGIRVVIVVDGLDHVPREEHPDRSLLTGLPLPAAIPDGVVFVLGTQRLDLADMPPAVRQQAAAGERRVEIAPLTELAVDRVADALGLDPDIDRRAVYAVTQGHPLVTRYLVERLLTAAVDEKSLLLAGRFGFGGDLASIYDAAWRGIDSGPDPAATKRVLALIAFAEGAIEPERLAESVSEQAVEAALAAAGHLLDRSARGWTVFHNSFRLFVQEKPVQRFGKTDLTFAAPAIFFLLADLADRASPTSPQRWLRFRYLFLAGEVAQASALAGRSHFIDQYVAGREAKAVSGDIRDAIALLRDTGDAAALFDLMLADAELDSRTSIMESATSLVDACLAAGDIEGAQARLLDQPGEGKQWAVVEALLEIGDVARARALFERFSPFRQPDRNGAAASIANADLLAWARFAIVFLDEDQIENRLNEGIETSTRPDVRKRPRVSHGPRRERRSQLLSRARLQVARAFIGAEPSLAISRVARRWSIGKRQRAVLLIEAAVGLAEGGDHVRARDQLQRALNGAGFTDLHPSWDLAAARAALRAGSTELAKRFLARVPVRTLEPDDSFHKIENMAPTCRQLLAGVAAHVATGREIGRVPLPTERLLRGAQTHLIAIGSAIGKLRGGGSLAAGAIDGLSLATLRFLAAARTGKGDGWFTSHLMPPTGDILLEGLFALAAAVGDGAERIAMQADQLLAAEKTLFRWWPSFRRILAVSAYRLGGCATDAAQRLESGLTDLAISDPREEIEQRVQYAQAFADIGYRDRARAILADLRAEAFGLFLPAKKDGQYELWSDTLARANAADPAGRGERATVALPLLDGLRQTEGRDSGWRITRNLLFEASAARNLDTRALADWVAERGIASWDGLVDTQLRGAIARGSISASGALIAWAYLALPWYAEPHGSTTDNAQFIADLVAFAALDELPALEAQMSDAIVLFAQPGQRLACLRKLEDAVMHRGGSGQEARDYAASWTSESHRESTDPEHRSYRHVIDLAGIAQALTSEQAYRDAHPPDHGGRPERTTTYGLRRAAARVIGASEWTEVARFLSTHGALLGDSAVAIAAVRSAMSAGCGDEARALAAPMISSEAEGWAWPSSQGKLHYHKARHLLGERDRYEQARQDLFDELRQSRFGLAPLLWAADEIFPLVFEEIDWPAIWDRLAAQLAAMREMRLGVGPIGSGGNSGNEDPIAGLFCLAFTLGATPLRDQAAAGFTALLRTSHHDIAIAICERLMGTGDEATLTAAALLVTGADDEKLAAHFLPKLADLGASADAGIAAAASYLGQVWGTPLPVELRDLPVFYTILLPDTDSPSGAAVADEQTRGMVIEDPMGWTQSWLSLIRQIARDAGVSVPHIRWRVRQLIHSWGGLEAFGHNASTALEARLGRLDIKLVYGRPQAIAVLRALRRVLGELWRAEMLDSNDFTFLLDRLHAHPARPALPHARLRPKGVTLAQVPRMLWGRDQDAWLDGVEDDLTAARSPLVVAEWRVSLVRETRVTAVSEVWHGAAGGTDKPETLDDWLASLPNVIHLGAPLPLYGPSTRHPSFTAVLEPNVWLGEPTQLLVFCPIAAAELRWRMRTGSAHRYIDEAGQDVARSLWWRAGLPQSIDEDDDHAFGQQVVLSEAGAAQFAQLYGALPDSQMAWRRVETAPNDGPGGTRFASRK